MNFALSDIDIRWSGRDDTTPSGHCTALGKDSLGNTRVWLFVGDTPSEEGFRGSILIPPPDRPSGLTAYDRKGSYVTSQGDTTAMLEHLVRLAVDGNS